MHVHTLHTFSTQFWVIDVIKLSNDQPTRQKVQKPQRKKAAADIAKEMQMMWSNSFVFTKNILYGRLTEYRQCNSLILHLNKSESGAVCGVLTSICLDPYLSAFVHKFRLKRTFQCWSCNNDTLRLKIINRFARTPCLYSGTALFDLGFNWS